MNVEPENYACVRAVITGRVQGVSYRGWTVETATKLGLLGWVRNRDDGAVEALFAGPPAVVAQMLVACRSGPTAAQVEGVAIQPVVAPAGLAGFQQLATA